MIDKINVIGVFLPITPIKFISWRSQIASSEVVSFKFMTQMRASCAIMCAVDVGSLVSTVMLGGFAALVAPGALMGQVDQMPWHYPCM